jgi:hypothetical protein
MNQTRPAKKDKIEQARAAFARLRPRLSAASQAAIEEKLTAWSGQLNQQDKSSRPPLPELVMRPGLPPRPLNKHYFTVVRSL